MVLPRALCALCALCVSAVVKIALILKRTAILWFMRNAITQHNIRSLYWDIATFGVTNGIAATFLSVYALRLGASGQQMGLLTALPALVYVFCFIPAGRFIESRRDRKGTGLRWLFVLRLQYLLFALIAFLPPAYRVPALLVLIAAQGIPMCVANVAFTSIIGDVVAPERRPRVVSNRNILLALISAATALAAGKLLNVLPMPLNYQILFFVAYAFGLLSMFALSRLVVPDVEQVGSFSLQPRLFTQQIREIVQIATSNRAFMRFTLGSLIMHAALVYAWPLFALWWINGLKASESVVGLVATGNLLVIVLANPVWARIAERKGNRFVLLAGFLGVCVVPVAYCLAPSAELVIIAEIIAGLAVPGVSMGLFNSMLEVCPAERRPAYISFYSATVNIPIFLAPMIATSIVVPLVGVWWALFAATFIRLGAWLALFKLIRQRA